ncbi:peptidoglycan DD-metalloendopeptidase family protein [Sphingomonas jatrophae]|uniref:Murein DD-endopeptidase MepM and murein hydrolase activator NlpD, contain LysM domain n=1 Tax=Sphingomonas jatrophae TaxID=1166337 RepID=A0A1I6LK35_9SPHN|nr:peptidoglycan DD-metalloendopeptidase family protein [Sphingomonas jatrophae]SFS03887.1 Murein DD-endopeptidase MepM and murein hydrolase activator NlpD, contain LysM domain [Sphingomonas jatrophae]
MMSDEDDPSFDPRTWSAAGATTPGAAPAAAPPSPEATPQRERRAPSPALLGGGAALALLVAGGVAALVSRPGGPQPSAPVAPAATPAAKTAPAATVAEARRTLVLSQASELRAALADAGVPATEADAAAAAALRTIGERKGELRAVLTLLQGGAATRLARLDASFEDSSGVVVKRSAGGFDAAPVKASLSTVVTVIRGEMDANSFYTSAVAAGVTDTLIPDFAKAFAFDFDFQREIHPGDVFEAAFEQQKNAAGQPVGTPRLLFASLTTGEKSRSLYWFQPAGEEGGWFDGNGASIVRALMRTPVDGARVSSQFGIRTHPVLGFVKMHKGTDFAAPTGTPIYASGDATVQWAAMKGANGNLTILRHDNGWQTYYLHQSAFMPGIVAGARVHQGQEIGKVGTTGRSTGPHLHYEVHIDGAPVDPLSIQTESGRTLTGAPRTAFIKERDRIDVARAARAG